MSWTRPLLLLSLLAAGCGSGEPSIRLVFPSEGARQATQQLAIFAFRREDAAGSGLAQSCSEYLGKLAAGQPLGINPIDNPLEPPFDGRQITNFPSGDPLVLVVAYNGTGPEKKPILEGCSDTYGRDAGTDDVPINLQVVLPKKVSLTKIGGDRQVGRPGEDLTAPLRVRVDAILPGAPREVYPLAGVKIAFSTAADVSLGGGAPGAMFEAFTDASGIASVTVKMPEVPGGRQVEAVGQSVAEACKSGVTDLQEEAACDRAAAKTFLISTVEPAPLVADRTIAAGRIFDVPVAIELGDVDGSGMLDAVVLGCEGSADGCRPGRFATAPLGRTRLALVHDVASGGRVSQPQGIGDLGLAPGAILAGELIEGGGTDVALLNSRKPCSPGCGDSAEVMIFRGDASGLTLHGRYALTASNAVGLVGYKLAASDPVITRLVTAGQGRTASGRPCKQNPPCLPDRIWGCNRPEQDCGTFCPSNPTEAGCFDQCEISPEECGCPAGERCDCPPGQSCQSPSAPGVCVAQDKDLDLLDNRTPAGGGFVNTGGCQVLEASCSKTGGANPSTSCVCRDRENGNQCSAEDLCGCRIPNRLVIGAQAGVIANDLALGPLRRTAAGPDIIAASDGGLEYILHRGSPFTWSVRKTPTTPIHGVRFLQLDDDQALDILWWSRSACQSFSGIEEQCPSARQLDEQGRLEGAEVLGCLGLYLRVEDEDRIDVVKPDGCRRHALPFRPDGVCAGDFNGDRAVDVAMTSLDAPELFLFLGDAQGGLLDPPDKIALPPNALGGPLACADLDGDGRTDVVSLSRTGDVHLVRTDR